MWLNVALRFSTYSVRFARQSRRSRIRRGASCSLNKRGRQKAMTQGEIGMENSVIAFSNRTDCRLDNGNRMCSVFSEQSLEKALAIQFIENAFIKVFADVHIDFYGWISLRDNFQGVAQT